LKIESVYQYEASQISKLLGYCGVFKICLLDFPFFAQVEKDFMANPLPPESLLPNVSFHTKTSHRINNIESGEGGFFV